MRKRIKRSLAAALGLILLFSGGCAARPAAEDVPVSAASAEPSGEPAAYADTLFDPGYVHTIDILVPEREQWDAFIATCTEKDYMRCDMVIDGELFRDAAIRGKGNSSMQRSRATGKYGFKVEFDHFADQTFRGLDKLVLNNLVVDDSCLRDFITFRMMDAFGVPAPLCSYVFVTVNGEDWGFYLGVEGIEDAFLERNYGPDHGDLYKPDNLAKGGGMPGWGRSEDMKLQYIDGDPDSYPNIFNSAKTGVSHQDQIRLIEALRRLNAGEAIPETVDTEEFLRYLTVHTFVCNGDSYTGTSVHNYYLYVENGRLAMLPWDYNEAFGDFGSFGGMASAVNQPIDSPVTSGTLEERPMVAWVFAEPDYTDRYHVIYEEFLESVVDSGWLSRELTSARELIAPFVARDPRSFCTVDSFEMAGDQLALFFELRTESVRGQLTGTIPSTSEGQAADRSALIDGSALGGSSSGMPGASGERGTRPTWASGEASGEPSGGNG